MSLYRTSKVGGMRLTRNRMGLTSSRSVKAGASRVTLSNRGPGNEFVRQTSHNPSAWTRIFQGHITKLPRPPKFEETQGPKHLRDITSR